MTKGGIALGAKYKTVKDNFPDMIKSLEALNGKKVNVGCIRGDSQWLAAIHEYGCNIRVTSKMRAYLHHKGIHLKPTTTVIRIPERKFLTVPVHPDAVGKKAKEISDLFVFTAKSGEKFLAKSEGKNLVLYYWLTESVKIPERSFLRAGHDAYIDEVMDKASKLVGQVIDGKMSEEQLLDFVGLTLSTKIKTYARDLSSPPNSSFTIDQKGSSNPLVDTGNMIGGIYFEVE